MPRVFSSALLVEKNRIQSTHPWIYLFQADIQGAAGPYRLAAYDQQIVFHGGIYAPYPLRVEQLETPTHAALVQLRVEVGNVNQEMQALFETYWAPQPSPQWTVRIWECDATQPDQTPLEAAEVFSVQQATTDLLQASFDLIAEGMTLTANTPKRRYTSSHGFEHLPRR